MVRKRKYCGLSTLKKIGSCIFHNLFCFHKNNCNYFNNCNYLPYGTALGPKSERRFSLALSPCKVHISPPSS